MSISSSRQWAVEEFGEVALGDGRRRRRTVSLAAAVATAPAGRLTQVFETDADREAAFRWVRNKGVEERKLVAATSRATVRRCESHQRVFVAVDQSSVRVVDRMNEKGFGLVGNRRPARGLRAMTALAVSANGATLGLVGQTWWNRPDKRSLPYSRDRRAPEQRESGLWMRTMQQCLDSFDSAESSCHPWFQLDRGADASHVLLFAQQHNVLMTVRAAHNRRLADSKRYLWPTVKTGKVRGRMQVKLSRSQALRSRRNHRSTVTLAVRFQSVVLRVQDIVTRAPHEIPMVAIHVRERRPPQGVDRIEWMLLTTAPVSSLHDALGVVDGYTQRWRVEDFHRTWKTGRCNVESSQLRSPSSFRRWATLLAAVAARIERLKHLARSEPDSPATEVLSRDELDAAIVLSKTKKWKRGAPMTVADAVTLIASVGGYTGKSSGGPPGSITIGRGLERVTHVAVGLKAARSD